MRGDVCFTERIGRLKHAKQGEPPAANDVPRTVLQCQTTGRLTKARQGEPPAENGMPRRVLH